MMKSAAKQKGAAGAAIAADVGRRMSLSWSRWPERWFLALLLTYGGAVPDILGIILGGGSAAVAGNAIAAVRKDYK